VTKALWPKAGAATTVWFATPTPPPHTKVSDYPPPPPPGSRQYFSDSDWVGVAEAVNLPLHVGDFCKTFLAECIDSASAAYVLHSQTRDHRSTAGESARSLMGLEKRARAILDWFGISDYVSGPDPEAVQVIAQQHGLDDDAEPDWLSSRERFQRDAKIAGELTAAGAIRIAILGVQLLERRASLGARAQKALKAKKRTPDEPLLHLFKVLNQVFEEAFGRLPGFSTAGPGTAKEGQRGGPAVRFAGGVVRLIIEAVRLDPQHDRAVLNRLECIARSPEAIAEGIRGGRGGRPRRR
jgi:hypothetical protein